jgi:hypothetical protein
MERWMWAVLPCSWTIGQESPAIVAMGVSDDKLKAIEFVEFALLHDESAILGEITGPGGKVLVARRSINRRKIVWRDRWPVDDDPGTPDGQPG